MSDDSRGQEGEGDDCPQPASGPMDQATAERYVRLTRGQFQAFCRDGSWYLYVPDGDDGQPTQPERADG